MSDSAFLGNEDKAPKLTTMDDYPNWRNKFELHVNGVDESMWTMITDGYSKPRTMDGTVTPIFCLSKAQRKEYDTEMQAFTILSQSMSKDISHQFRHFTSSKGLWDALEKKNEEIESLKKIRAKELKREFDSFSYKGNESLHDLISRYCNLLRELFAVGVKTTMTEKVLGLVNALPPSWNAFIMGFKQSNLCETMDINDIIKE